MDDFVCKKCGSTEYEIKDKPNGTGIAHGLYCAKCGFWHKWLNKDELKKLTTIKAQEKCNSIDEVNHLISEEDKLIQKLKAENAALRERLEKAEKEIDEYKRKIEYGKLVEPVWFISLMNDLPCYGRVIGYQEDSGYVMDCTDCMISAKEIYFSEKEALDSLAELKGEKK